MSSRYRLAFLSNKHPLNEECKMAEPRTLSDFSSWSTSSPSVSLPSILHTLTDISLLSTANLSSYDTNMRYTVLQKFRMLLSSLHVSVLQINILASCPPDIRSRSSRDRAMQFTCSVCPVRATSFNCWSICQISSFEFSYPNAILLQS